jgi:hypothetical protein
VSCLGLLCIGFQIAPPLPSNSLILAPPPPPTPGPPSLLSLIYRGELANPSPSAPRFSDCKDAVECVLTHLHSAREGRGRALSANDGAAVKVFDEYISELESSLIAFGFNCKLKSKMWWERSPIPEVCPNFIDVWVLLKLSSGKTPADVERVFMPSLAGSARTSDTCVRFCLEHSPPLASPGLVAPGVQHFCRVIVVAPSPENAQGDLSRISGALSRLAQQAVEQGILASSEWVRHSNSLFQPPQYGLLPWTLHPLDYCKFPAIHVSLLVLFTPQCPPSPHPTPPCFFFFFFFFQYRAVLRTHFTSAPVEYASISGASF